MYDIFSEFIYLRFQKIHCDILIWHACISWSECFFINDINNVLIYVYCTEIYPGMYNKNVFIFIINVGVLNNSTSKVLIHV